MLFRSPPYCGCGCNFSAIGEVAFLLLKYFASSLPDGPGIKISKILLSINDTDNCSQKKLYLSYVDYILLNILLKRKLDYFSQVYI